MNKVKLEEIDSKNSFFHFTNRMNIELIKKYGLLPAIGESSKGIENTKKIFFAKGTDGILKICDVWIKLLMNRMNNYYSLINQYKGEELDNMAHEWDLKFLSKEYLKDVTKKNKTFEKMFNDMRERKYLILDLENGIDFSYNDIDEAKEYALQCKTKNNDNKNYKYMKEFYGSYSNVDIPTVETWNMHTYTGINIFPSKISQLITQDGRENALSILIEVYDRHRNKDIKFDLLDEFIEYSKERIKEEDKSSLEEEIKFQPEKVSELLRKNGFESLVVKLGNETLVEQNNTNYKDSIQKEIQEQSRNLYNNDKSTR